MTFGEADLYSNVVDKAVAIGFSLIMNHPFLDGNKRMGHAAMETFLVLNGHEIAADVGEQERVILDVAAGAMNREAFAAWVHAHVVSLDVDSADTNH